VRDLIGTLKENKQLEDAMQGWSKLQVGTGKRLLALGEQMEKAFIWEQPDFAKIDENTAKNWWKESVTFPENFNYEGE
jgi:hypothetical protein